MALRVRATVLDLIIQDPQTEDTDHRMAIIVHQTDMLVTDHPGMMSAIEIGHAAGKGITGARKSTTMTATVIEEVDVTVNVNVPGRKIGKGSVREKDRGVELRNNQG